MRICTNCGAKVQDGDVCPNCGAEGARGDQCDACGAYYDQIELINPISMVTNTKPIIKNTTH